MRCIPAFTFKEARIESAVTSAPANAVHMKEALKKTILFTGALSNIKPVPNAPKRLENIQRLALRMADKCADSQRFYSHISVDWAWSPETLAEQRKRADELDYESDSESWPAAFSSLDIAALKDGSYQAEAISSFPREVTKLTADSTDDDLFHWGYTSPVDFLNPRYGVARKSRYSKRYGAQLPRYVHY